MQRSRLNIHNTLSLLVIAFICSQTLAEDEEVDNLRRRTDNFFHILLDDVDPEKAFNDLLADGPLAGRDEEIRKLIEKVQRFEQTYGKLVETEAIGEKRVGKDLVLLKYLYKMERFPLVWYITYYRSPRDTSVEKDWGVIAVQFDTRLDLLWL